MSYETLIPLIKKTGSPLAPKDFQEAVNVIFHDIEANYYDSIHQNMWNSLQEQVNLLVDDLMGNENFKPVKLSLLDVGCGTGLSTQLLLNSTLGKYIDRITLLDTSPNMLKQAEKRSREWNKNVDTFNSTLSGISKEYDVILVCSVLHHIPDLKQFLEKVDQLQSGSGIFIHLQDPNGDFTADTQYANRIAAYGRQNIFARLRGMVAGLIPVKLKYFINKKFRTEPYIDLVNDKLISENIIKNRMTPEEIWSVTDIHVENLPYSTRAGISFNFLQQAMENYGLVTRRSYAYYGLLKSELTEHYQKLEAIHISNKELNGRLFSAVWMKKQLS